MVLVGAPPLAKAASMSAFEGVPVLGIWLAHEAPALGRWKAGMVLLSSFLIACRSNAEEAAPGMKRLVVDGRRLRHPGWGHQLDVVVAFLQGPSEADLRTFDRHAEWIDPVEYA